MSLRVAAGSAPADTLVVTGLCFGWFILTSLQAVAAGFPAAPFSDSDFIGLIALEIAFGAAALAAVAWLVAVLIGAGHTASEPIGEMVAGARISLAPLVAMSIVNGIYEEVFLLGYLQRALEGFGAAFAVGVSLLVRLLCHLYQGPSGALYVLGFGLVLSLYFLRTGKLWPVAFAHIFADFAGFSTS
jgi:membrane protease YdiL (CAAX protease family)